MDEELQLRRELSERIDRRRASIGSYLHRTRPRQNRLSTLSVVGSSVVAALTAGPGVGQQGFTTSVAGLLALQDSSLVWRVICLLATVLSVAVALATHLATSKGRAEQISAAQTCNAELEGLQAALAFSELPLDEAVRLYQQYSVKAAFIEDLPAG
jgi:cytochrome bd-type quinol oxidase subunit 2